MICKCDDKSVAMGWDCHPTITKGDNMVLPRPAELIINGDFYEDWKNQKWPVCPQCKSKLPIEHDQETHS